MRKMSLIQKIKKHLIKGTFIKATFKKIVKSFNKIIDRIDFIIGFFIRKIIFSTGEIQNNKLYFATFDGKYNCNLKYITDEILRQQLPVEIVWRRDKKVPESSFPNGIKTVIKASQEDFEEMSSSKIWFDNALNCVWYGMPKKKEQIYINTWHGSMGIKRLSGNRLWMFRARRCKKRTDYCISNSQFEEDVYKTTFWPESEYLKYGHARNDILLQTDKHSEILYKVKNYFELNDEDKIALYAPTFRDDGTTDCYSIDFSRLKNNLEQKFGGNWVLLVRMHHKNSKVVLSDEWNKWLKNANKYPDMQELMVAVDIGITDYSSWAYDYVITRKPLFIYATDIEKYDTDRGFYYSLYTTPFPVSTNNEELERNILSFDLSRYIVNCDKFLNEKGCYETGEAAKLIVEKIKEIIGI